MATNWDELFYSPLSDPRYASNVFRYQTGGASPALTGTASQLVTGNEGTRMADLMRQGAERGGEDAYRRALAQTYQQGGGGNYNALASISSGITQGVNNTARGAYADAARINQQGVYQGGQLYGEADKLNQQSKRDSLNYLAQLRPDQINPGNLAIQKNLEMGLTPGGGLINNEGFGASLAKGLIGGALTGFGGAGLGWLAQGLFGQSAGGASQGGGWMPYGSGIRTDRTFGLWG